jgi:hypothetical protein
MRAYLAGPIADCTDEVVFGWREDLKQRMPSVHFVDPTTRDFRGQRIHNPAEVIEPDKADIDSCDTLIAYCPFPTVGTSMEVLYAWQAGKRVLIYAPAGAPVSPWLRYHSEAVFDSVHRLEAALVARVPA